MIVALDLYSYHASPEKEYENITPGIFVIGDSGCGGGAYRNSERKYSAHLGYMFNYDGIVRLYVGLVTGYASGPLPFVLPSAAFPVPFAQDVKIGVGFIPKIEPMGSAVVHFTLERKF